MSEGSTAGCLVCRKHWEQGPLVPGGPVAEDELVLVSHIAPGTPREYWATHVNKWPQARRGTAAEIGALVQELRGYLGE